MILATSTFTWPKTGYLREWNRINFKFFLCSHCDFVLGSRDEILFYEPCRPAGVSSELQVEHGLAWLVWVQRMLLVFLYRQGISNPEPMSMVPVLFCLALKHLCTFMHRLIQCDYWGTEKYRGDYLGRRQYLLGGTFFQM